LTVILTSCSFFVPRKETFIIINESSNLRNISFFKSSILLEELSIEAGENYKKKIEVKTDESTTYPFNISTDSIAISFNNEKVIINYCDGKALYGNFDSCQFDKNLMDFETGTYVRKEKYGKSSWTIVFDQSDYKNAMPIW
jgi:hypothetical protein